MCEINLGNMYQTHSTWTETNSSFSDSSTGAFNAWYPLEQTRMILENYASPCIWLFIYLLLLQPSLTFHESNRINFSRSRMGGPVEKPFSLPYKPILKLVIVIFYQITYSWCEFRRRGLSRGILSSSRFLPIPLYSIGEQAEKKCRFQER